jgi:hypothetical protein
MSWVGLLVVLVILFAGGGTPVRGPRITRDPRTWRGAPYPCS